LSSRTTYTWRKPERKIIMNNKHKAALLVFLGMLSFLFWLLFTSISALKADVEAKIETNKASIETSLSTKIEAVKAEIDVIKKSVQAIEDHNNRQGGSLERHNARLKSLEAIEAERQRRKSAARRAAATQKLKL